MEIMLKLLASSLLVWLGWHGFSLCTKPPITKLEYAEEIAFWVILESISLYFLLTM